MKKKKKFILVVYSGTQSFYYKDLMSDDRTVVLHSYQVIPTNIIFKFLYRLHFSCKMNKLIKLPLKNIWKCSLETINWDPEYDYYVILFLDAYTPINISVKYLHDLQKKHNITYVGYFIDSYKLFCNKNREIVKNVGFKYIFAFGENEAMDNNFFNFGVMYSTVNCNTADMVSNDLYYVGLAKDRLKKLHSIFNYLDEKNVKMIYRICNASKQDFKYDKIIYNRWIDYEKMIKELKVSNCILEILQEGQTDPTIRWYEAINYNKKLLTNNKNVVNLPFYNPEYIHVFEKPEDIDCNWVKERIQVDYHYDGRFSPVHLIDKIIELEDEKNNSFDK